MPNWIDNIITIKCQLAEEISSISSTNFDFQTILPCSNCLDKDRIRIWGALQAKDIRIDEDELTLIIQCRTRTTVPHGILAYLTMKYPNVQITNVWTEEIIETVGQSTYNLGNISSSSFEPTFYKPYALRKFSLENSWFSFDRFSSYYYDDLSNYVTDENDDTLLNEVIVKTWHKKYAEFINYS